MTTSSDSPVPKIRNAHFDRFYVGGAWVKPAKYHTLKVYSPVSGNMVVEVAEAVEADVLSAVNAARSAFDNGPWPNLSPSERATYLTELASQLRGRSDDLAAVWAAQTGVVAGLADAASEYAISAIDRNVAFAETFPFVERHEVASGAGYLVQEPVGVVAAIAPWNVPLITMLNKIAPALLAGCTLIMKPAPQTPGEAYIIAECAEQAGLPPGVVNLITAERDVSDFLVQHQGVDKVSFTGSVAAGKRIASVCGERIARVTLELGGKSAAIILDDYDLEAAAESLAPAVCMIAGQNCAALTRVIVSRDRHDQLVDFIVKRMESIKVGDPRDPETQLGPLAMARQLERVQSFIATGISEGATLAFGGRTPNGLETGCYIEPTVFSNVENSMTIAREEIFGPVLCIIPCDGEDHAVEIANDSPFGLMGAVYTNDANKAFQISRRIRTGTMGQSGPLADFNIGFGGFKQSGLGREGGAEGLRAYLEPKTILLSQEPSIP